MLQTQGVLGFGCAFLQPLDQRLSDEDLHWRKFFSRMNLETDFSALRESQDSRQICAQVLRAAFDLAGGLDERPQQGIWAATLLDKGPEVNPQDATVR